LNKISSESLKAEIRAKLKTRGMATIGAISYDALAYLSGLKGDPLNSERAILQAGKILDSLLPAKT